MNTSTSLSNVETADIESSVMHKYVARNVFLHEDEQANAQQQSHYCKPLELEPLFDLFLVNCFIYEETFSLYS